MTEFIRRHSLLITSILLVICSFQLMTISLRNKTLPRLGGQVLGTALSPFERGYNAVVHSTRYLWNHYVWLQGVESERNDLLIRVKALEAQNSKLLEFASENQRLRSLLNFSEKTGLRGVAASVIGRDPSNWVKTITIDRGRRDGLREGLPVVDGQGIVGQTTVVTENSANVLLLTDNTSAIDAIVQSSRASGIAEGNADQKLRLRYTLKENLVQLGDRVIASGLDGVFPKGTLIGVVTTVEQSKSGIFQNVEIQPSVDLNRLENVLVLIPEWTAAPDAAANPPGGAS